MNTELRPKNVITLKQALEVAEKYGFAIGSFSPRYTPMITPVLRAAEKMKSPAIVQISHKELIRYGITPKEFADEFYEKVVSEGITVPLVLHLDHTKELETIALAIDAGFTSVMIDASEKNLEDNISTSKEVADYAHAKGVSVEAELGMIGTTDFVETDKDEELYTDPQEAKRFVNETNIDALAVSCGTAHGVYMVRQPKIDVARLQEIRSLTPVHLVLHGGSGVPAEMMEGAIRLPSGGVSKVNIATDLELSFLGALEREERLTNEECKALEPSLLEKGRAAVENTVIDKMIHFLGSKAQADHFA
ncbi:MULTISPECIES: class II fructose-bisphosphate aldolase [unclassified Paenibacillus]|uniref:class II fructose-bisphosphate aldolase n=1 Tax=unclassified Paenibacillus TaxID=185978 RepID=UPI00278784D3|nr:MULTISPECIES: class II fructose-bisphosphate aldolase [unclassified Paenibacillus]MDQ0897986.1 ketose-bisphosphate aldolase [Paenibacillus sp. V4I7]MDQ0916012.1 ketose-bisphosphate aldolase [Paenibacillus sp. V4I5]